MTETTFDYKRIAEGYAKRPFLHKQVMEEFLQNKRFRTGLDIGCGAGLSTKAIKPYCEDVLGTDISKEMILVAEEMCPDCHFRQVRAEELEEESSFDLITAAGVMNWVDETVFLPKCRRLLSRNGYFLVYDFWISDRMKDNAGYADWYRNRYLLSFPKPPRKEEIWTNQTVETYGLQMKLQKELHMPYEMGLDDYVEFMLLQSNVIAKVEEKGRPLPEVKQWFYDTLTPIWNKTKEILYFDGYLWVMQRATYSAEPDVADCGCIYG